ncbi:MAG: Endonuclease/exonuclease/phosphatase [Verrucomicrobiaceae bacterium]|nr:Endonuclease/exonuclease/phosphatase [Verrucomicrobiaceae bacterium]
MAALTSLKATTVSTGGMAVVGYQDNASTDYFTVLATEDIAAGTVVYFTNNGWSNTGSEFSGVSASSSNAAGGQQLMKFTVNSTITSGTILSSADTSNSAFSWNTSGSIPGASSSHFSNLNLLHDANQADRGSDQIYILQAGNSRPLDNISNFIFALDLGDPNASRSGFSEPTGFSSGAVPDGNVRVNGNPGNIVFSDSALSDESNSAPNDNTAIALDPASNFHDGTFGLDLSNPDFIAMNAIGGTKAEWLSYLSDSAHWSSQSSLTTGTGVVNITVVMVPEPSRMLLLLIGACVVLKRRQRRFSIG